MATKTVNYTFENVEIRLEITVSAQIGDFEAADEKTYPGFAIQSGSGVVVPATGQKFNIRVAPQSVNPYNVLWAGAACGSGGSSSGIDTNGIAMLGDNGVLVWNGSEEGSASFWLQETAANGPTILVKTSWNASSS